MAQDLKIKPTSISSSSGPKFVLHPKMQSTLCAIAFIIIALVIPMLAENHHQDVPSRSNNINKRRFPEDAQGEEYSFTPTVPSGCGSCKMRKEIKNRNLEAIKSEVLRRMGFQSAPNVTGRSLPKVPAHVMAKFDQSYGGMQSDEPQFKTGFSISEEEDEYHVKTEKVLSFAQPCK